MSALVTRRFNVNVSGKPDGQPMLFAHGFGCDQRMWRFVAPAFERDYRVVLFDYVGFGQSDHGAYRSERYDSLAGYAADVLEICRALELDDVVFVGHSVSALIGMLAAIREPDRFARLVLVGPSPCYLNDAPHYFGGFTRADIEGLLEMMEGNYLGWASYLAPAIMKNPERPELAAELEDSFCSTDPRIASEFARVTFLSDNRADVPSVTAPSLILQCTDDAIAPLSVGEFLARNLPRGTLHVLRATGHCPHMSHPEEVVAAMKDYLSAPAA